MKKIILTAFTIGVVVFGVQAQQAIQGEARIPKKSAQQSLNNIDRQFFIENKGQWPEEVLYLTQMGGVNTWITTKGMLYEFYKTEEVDQSNEPTGMVENVTYKHWGHRVAYKLMENNTVVRAHGKQKQAGYYNYLIGNDQSKHASNIGLYKEAVIKEVYDGIDMRYYFDNGFLRYDYIVHPEADPGQIQFTFEGSEKTYLNENGELVFTTCFGEVKNAELYSYQEQDKKSVDSRFIKQGENWTINLEDYDKSQTLVIDPLVYSTYIGGSNDGRGNSITLDASGNAYITGRTRSVNYDTTPGAFQTTIQGQNDAFVSKLNATGTALIYSTYIGGDGDDGGQSIVIDASNNAYITGYTYSMDYPSTSGAYQTLNDGGFDAIVSKLNATGTALIYSTQLGGAGNDVGQSIAIDASNNVYITGYTHSTNYDVTSGAFQTVNDGQGDIFVTKLNSLGTLLIYSTYIGGAYNDYSFSIALDGLGNAYVAGRSNSNVYDVTPGVYQSTRQGYEDVVVSKLNASGTNLVYSTYIGGSDYDAGYSIAVDASRNAYVTGMTQSSDYDATPGAYRTLSAGMKEAFVSKLNETGTDLVYSTYIGGSNDDYGFSIVVDGANACIAGLTVSTDYPATTGAYQNVYSGAGDVIVSKLNTSGSTLTYSTYIGGNSTDAGYAIALDASTNVYVTGHTSSTNYDVTTGVFQTVNDGGYDAFVSRLCLPNVVSISSTATTICQGAPVTLTATGASNYTWTSSTGGTYTGSQITVAPNTTTTYTVTDNNVPCESQESITITVNPTPNFDLGSDIVLCPGDPFPTICPNGSFGKGTSYSWSGPGIVPGTVTTGCYQPTQFGYFCLTVTFPSGCSTTKCITVSEHPNASYNPEYALNVDCSAGSNVTITPIYSPLPPGMSQLIIVDVWNGSVWTNIMYVGTSFDLSGLTFLKGETYRIRRRVWGPCFPLQEIIHTASCAAGRGNGEVLIDGSETEFVEKGSVGIYPNPNNGQFNVELTNTKEGALIEVYDLMGKQILHSEMNGPAMQLDLSDQPKGVYLVRITVGEEVFNERVIYQ